jgi:hypothetical protein
MNKLEQRVAKLEQKRQKPDTSKPSWEEMHAAEQRRLARTQARLTGKYPEGDTPEQAAHDTDVIRRWNRAEGTSAEDLTGLAEQCKEKPHDIGGGRAA